jgi:hypothetical protein
MPQESIAGPRAGPSTADLVLERLPNGEFAWLRPESEHWALRQRPVQPAFRRDHPRICPVCHRPRPLQARQIGTRQDIGRPRAPSPESPRPTARRGRSPISALWCCLFWLAIAIWAVFVLSSVSWEIPG